MIQYLSKAKKYIKCFKNFKIQNIPQNQNQKADVLSKLASVAFNCPIKEILVEVLEIPSTEMKEINAVVEEERDNWITPIIKYLSEGKWPEDTNEARALCMKINQYVMEEGVLFQRSVQHAPEASGDSSKIYSVGLLLANMHRNAREEIRSLAFGSEADIPVEIFMPTHRTMTIKEGTVNEEEIRLNLNLL
ncbi:hypothetical protein Tco_1058357 [Tanacetum coccineum]|uniref:Uncharacterized protein n=1 Tax=Tanacetum coccineum TaxID=301880 RepID=A0ABQ5H9I3_9ASTR